MGTDIFTLNKSNYFYVVDYHSKFPGVQHAEGLSADNLIKCCKIVFTEYELPRRIISEAGTNVISEKFKKFCGNQTFFMWYHWHTNMRAMA